MKSITRASVLVTLASCLLVSAASADELAQHKEKYDKALEEISLTHGMRVSDLNSNYAKALEGIVARSKRRGDLDGTKAALAEIERFKRDKNVPAEQHQNRDIQKYQAAYMNHRDEMEVDKARRILNLAGQYDAALIRLQRQLTSADNLQAATTVQTERKRVVATDVVVAAKAAIASAETAADHDVDQNAHALKEPEGAPPSPMAPDRAASLSHGLILHYSFEGTKKHTVSDQSGKKAHGKVVAGAQFTEEGRLGGGRAFDGEDDHIRCELDGRSLKAMSLAVWVEPSETEVKQDGIVQWADRISSSNPFFLLARRAADQRLVVHVDATYPLGAPLPNGEWAHVAATLDADGLWKLYVNGVNQGVYPAREEPAHRADLLVVGYGAGGFFRGTLDEVMVWDRALSPEEVGEIYQLQAPREGNE